MEVPSRHTFQLYLYPQKISINFRASQLLNEVIANIKTHCQERYLILTNENKRMIGFLDLNADYGARNMATSIFYHHKSLKYSDLNYYYSRYGFACNDREKMLELINYHKEMLYQHLLAQKSNDDTYKKRSRSYQKMILNLLENKDTLGTRVKTKKSDLKGIKQLITPNKSKLTHPEFTKSPTIKIGSKNPFK